MLIPYDHQEIEKKWQKKWKDAGIYKADNSSSKPKQYVLDMFPYPSGAGLHVGHVEGYTATDVYSRFKRMQGFEVMHPMGWDSFGLPAENYAIKTGTPPAVITEESIQTFTKQINGLGLSYDWSREIAAHTSEYYRWTQWMFSLLYKNNLAEKKKAKVNWCPKDQTVLANEQVVEGRCERCGTEVIQKELEQWFFKITEFANQLVKDLDDVDWPESTKLAQRNWIGKSQGVNYRQKVKDVGVSLEAYDSVPQTFMAQTFTVIGPDHPRLPEILVGLPNAEELLAKARKMTEKRVAQGYKNEKEMEGFFTGRYVENPFGTGDLPIWIASFVVGDYGTGFVNSSAHDERDFAFAKKYGIPLRPVMFPKDPAEAEKVRKLEYCYHHEPEGILELPLQFAGRKWGEAREEIISYIEEKGFGYKTTNYKLRDWLVSRQRYWGAPIPVVYDPEGKPHLIPDEHLPWVLPTDVEFKPTGVSPLAQSKELLERTEKIFGKGWEPEVDTMDTFVCSSWYFLRFADPKNTKEFASKELLKRWLPVDLYMGGAEHTVLHLMYARFFTKVLEKLGYVQFSEPFLKLRHQGTILAEDGKKMSKSLGNVINPDEVSSLFGADTIRVYEMFMGPLEAMKPWNTKGIMGPRRFIERVWRLADRVSNDAALTRAAEQVLHYTIKKVGNDIQGFALNTAISQLMICLNVLEELPNVPKAPYESYLKLLAPFAPHIADELWERLGHVSSIHLEAWPVFDPSKLETDTSIIAVQVGGKTRGTVAVPHGASEEEVLLALQNEPRLAKLLPSSPRRVVFVPGKIINLIP